MAQFTKYTSSDVGAPALTGRTGTLIGVLNFCLVTGQGWTHPVATAGDIGTFKQFDAVGTKRTLLINDAGPDGTSTFKEAWATGWTNCVGVGSPVGTGSGQFPLPSQESTTGKLWVRKSVAVDDAARAWQCYADGRTFHLFVKSEGTSTYYSLHFGEFYSLAGSADVGNCFIAGRVVTAATLSQAAGSLDSQRSPLQSSGILGSYFADTQAGGGGSTRFYNMGDPGKQSGVFASSSGLPTLGSIPAPNPADGAYYLSPLKLLDEQWNIRGRQRGLYHLCHPTASFADGATFNGAGDYAGKTFAVVSLGSASGHYCIETSDTLETN